jgi:hypothetical protein
VTNHDLFARLNGWSDEEAQRRKEMETRSHLFMEKVYGPDWREREKERNRKPSRCIHCTSASALFLIYERLDGRHPPIWQCCDCGGTLFTSESDRAFKDAVAS